MIRFASISKLSGLPNSSHTPGLCPRSMAARIFCEFKFCLTDQIAGVGTTAKVHSCVGGFTIIVCNLTKTTVIAAAMRMLQAL